MNYVYIFGLYITSLVVPICMKILSHDALRPVCVIDIGECLKVIYHPLYSMNNFVTNKSKLPQDWAQVFPYMG